MKKIISMLLCAAMFAGASYSLCSPAALADSVTEMAEESGDYIEETPSPEVTEEPSETDPPVRIIPEWTIRRTLMMKRA